MDHGRRFEALIGDDHIVMKKGFHQAKGISVVRIAQTCLDIVLFLGCKVKADRSGIIARFGGVFERNHLELVAIVGYNSNVLMMVS